MCGVHGEKRWRTRKDGQGISADGKEYFVEGEWIKRHFSNIIKSIFGGVCPEFVCSRSLKIKWLSIFMKKSIYTLGDNREIPTFPSPFLQKLY